MKVKVKVFETNMPKDTLCAWGIGVSMQEKIACYFFGTSEKETGGRCLAAKLNQAETKKLKTEILSLMDNRYADTPFFDSLAEGFRLAKSKK